MIRPENNIWTYHAQGHWVGVLTNGIVNTRNRAVMGKGVAKRAANRFPTLATLLGVKLAAGGNHVYVFPRMNLVTFPTKEHWLHPSPLSLVVRSASELAEKLVSGEIPGIVYLPPPGCGEGGLEREIVEPVIDDIFEHYKVSERVVVLWGALDDVTSRAC